jgi:hypothetical protein
VAHALERLAQGPDRPRGLQAGEVQPGAPGQAEVARPPEASSISAASPAITTGCVVKGFTAAGPSATRRVALAISSRGSQAGWQSMSW